MQELEQPRVSGLQHSCLWLLLLGVSRVKFSLVGRVGGPDCIVGSDLSSLACAACSKQHQAMYTTCCVHYTHAD